MNNLATLRDYEKAGYEGQDVNLDISLYEYGLIWKKTRLGDEWDFIYGVDYDGGEYTTFDVCGITSNKKNFLEEFDWVDWNDVSQVVGLTVKQLQELEIPDIVLDLLNYYGYINVFGTSVPFEIPVI